MKATKVTTRSEIKITTDIRPGPVTPHQRACWKKWWVARIMEAKQSEGKR